MDVGGMSVVAPEVEARSPVATVVERDLAEPEDDTREERMERVAMLYAEITAGTYEFLRALAESDRHEDWKIAGFGSCAEWLAWRIGVTLNTANEKVRVARKLEELPLTSEAMARGGLSFSKVRAVTRVATAENEEELLELARAASAAKLERVVRGWRETDRWSEAGRERRRHRRRNLSIFPDGEGMYIIRGVLSPEVAHQLMRALEAAEDWLFRAENPHDDDRPEPKQRRAEAVGWVAERALELGFGGSGGSRADRYQVMLHVEESTLAEDQEPGMSEVEDGTRVSAETARRLACDAGLVKVTKDPEGRVLNVGRKARTVAPALRRALEVRDRGCRFPGCGLRFADAHHVRHWADGGETRLENLVLLCRRHHRRVHEDGWRVCSDRTSDKVVFFTPNGRTIAEVPSAVEVRPGMAKGPQGLHPARDADPASALIRRNRARGVEPDGWGIAQGFNRDGDIPWEIEAAAWKALDSGEPTQARERPS